MDTIPEDPGGTTLEVSKQDQATKQNCEDLPELPSTETTAPTTTPQHDQHDSPVSSTTTTTPIVHKPNVSVSSSSIGKSPLPHKLIDPNLQQIPTEELLGSVTTFYPSGDAECGHALRTSARVIHKMRMDSIRGTTPPPVEKKDAGGGAGSGGTGKSGAGGGGVGGSQAKTPNQPKQVRMVWSNQDKNLFFEALNECGKDFEGIVNYLNTKKRRKDSNSEHALKVKDVRHLYYQFNQKVAKYLHFSDEVKKEAQELYALINYGEMRKKVPFQNKKYFHKLKDLVYKGFTTIREKGRNIRIKTPSCRALRKLNQLEEWQEEIKLPPRIDVVLKPATVDAWGRVQSLAQNPRVKISVTLQKRLSTLLQLLQQKWRHQDVRLVERINGLKSASANITSKASRQKAQHELELCARMAAEGATNVTESTKILRFTAPKETVIHRPMINLSEFLSSYSICLNSYEQRIGAKVRGEALCLEKLNAFKERVSAGSKRQRHDSGSEKHSPDGKKVKAEAKDGSKEEKAIGGEGVVIAAVVTNFNEVFKSPNASNESLDMAKDIEVSSDGECTSSVRFHPLLGTVSDTSLDGAGGGGPDLKSPESNDSLRLTGVSKIKLELETGVSVGGDNSNDGNGSETEPTVLIKQEEGSGEDLIKTTVKRKDSKEKCGGKRKDSKSGSMTGLSSLHFRPLISEETIQRVREGWTMQNVGDLTVGDLYIMFGEENRLQLEYGWVLPREVKTEQVESLNGVEPLEGVGVQEVAVTNGTNGIDDGTLNETIVLSGRLKQLLQIANLSEKTGKRRCPCGHVCDRKIKNHDQLTCASSSSDNLLFKTPKVPNRNGNAAIAGQANCNLVPSPHTAYKQTRWFRMRVNRHQLPSHRVMLPGGGGGGGHYLPGRNNNNNSPKLTSSSSSSSNGSTNPSSGYQSATSCSSTSSNGTSSGASSIRRPDDDSLTKLLEDKISSFQSGGGRTKKSRSTNLTASGGDDSSSLSLFDISLPSTSSSLLADLMGSETRNSPEEEREENSNITTISTTKILRESADGGELVETDINDISLSSFLGHLDAVYESEAAVTARRRDGDQMNISIISESSVDYIARFEDIAAELRAQQQAQEQQQQQQPDSIAEIEVHRS